MITKLFTYLPYFFSKKKRETLPNTLYWVSIYDRDGNVIDPIRRKVKYLDKDHIRNIYTFYKRGGRKVPYLHHLAFQIVLKTQPSIKFNSGMGAILCLDCYSIIKSNLTEDEYSGKIDCLYCDECKKK